MHDGRYIAMIHRHLLNTKYSLSEPDEMKTMPEEEWEADEWQGRTLEHSVYSRGIELKFSFSIVRPWADLRRIFL